MAQYRYDFEVKPQVNPKAVVAGDRWRFSILSDGLVR